MPSPFYRYDLRRSKIRRRCDHCSKIIPKRQTYYRGAGRANGVFSVQVLCCACGSAVEQQRKEDEQPEETSFDQYLEF